MCSVVRMCSGTRYTGAPTAQVPFFRPIGKVPPVYLISSERLGFFSSLLFAGISHDHASFKLVSSLGSVSPSSTHASWLAPQTTKQVLGTAFGTCRSGIRPVVLLRTLLLRTTKKGGGQKAAVAKATYWQLPTSRSRSRHIRDDFTSIDLVIYVPSQR